MDKLSRKNPHFRGQNVLLIVYSNYSIYPQLSQYFILPVSSYELPNTISDLYVYLNNTRFYYLVI